MPPNRSRKAGAMYKGLVDAKVGATTNISEGTHYGRAFQCMLRELFGLYGQPSFSGDDMNIIQVPHNTHTNNHQHTLTHTGGEASREQVSREPSLVCGRDW